MTDFVKQDGTLTEDGKAVVAYLNEQIALYDDPNDKLKLNGASGVVRDFWVKTKAIPALTEAEYLRDYPYAAGAAWSLVQHQQAQAQQAQQAQESTNALADALKQLREQVEQQAAELAALKESAPASKPATPKKPAKQADTAAAEAEDSAESEA